MGAAKLCLAVVLLAMIASAKKDKKSEQPKCAKKCLARECSNALGLRWGKYCGIGHTGCEGEEPCDAYDACCMHHDSCVGGHDGGMLDTDCHTELKTCLAKATKDEAKGWTESRTCKLKDVVNTMEQGMDLANLFSNAFKGKQGGGIGGGVNLGGLNLGGLKLGSNDKEL